MDLSSTKRSGLLSSFFNDFGFLPTHFIDINLQKARHNLFTFIVDTDEAERQFHKFRTSLSKRCFSKSHYRRFHRLVDACANVEISADGRPHIHSAFRRPDHLDDAAFDALVMQTHQRNPFFLKGKHAIKIMHVAEMTDNHLENKIPYNGKDVDGFDAYKRDHARQIYCGIFEKKYRKSRTDYRAFT